MRHVCISALFTLASLLAAGDADDGWQPLLGTLVGGPGDEAVTALAVGPDGSVWAGTTADPPAATLEVLGPAEGRASLLRWDARSGLLLSATRLPVAPQRIRVAADGSVFVAAGTIIAFAPDGATVRWQGGPAGRFDLDGAGGVWVAQKDRVVRIGPGGKELASFKAGTGWGNEDIAVDPQDGTVFTCGSRSDKGVSNPVHVPWVHAHKPDGALRWKAWDFPGKTLDAVGDMADSHPRRLWFGPDRRLYVAGDTEGGNSPYRHDPRKAGGTVGTAFEGASYGETWRAFRSVRMLFVGALDPKDGALLRGSWCYGRITNPEAKRLEVGDADVGDLAVDELGRVYLTGTMRSTPVWTGNAVHKREAPPDRKGRWGNLVATDECFLVVFAKDLRGQEFCSGFNQGGTSAIGSAGLAVAAGNGIAAVGGRVRGGSGPAEATSWLRAPWLADQAGPADGYLAVLAGSAQMPPEDPLARAQAALARLFPGEQPPLAGAAQRRDLGALIGELAAAGGTAARAAAVLTRIAESAIAEARPPELEDLAPRHAAAAAVARAWSGSPPGEAAAKRAAELAAHPDFAKSVELMRLDAQIDACLRALRPAAGAADEAWTDRAWHARNIGTLRRLQSLARDLAKRFPGTRAALRAAGECAGLVVPLSKEDEALAAKLARVWQQAAGLRLPPKQQEPDARNGDFRKLNEAPLAAIAALLKELREEAPASPYTRAGLELATRLRLDLK